MARLQQHTHNVNTCTRTVTYHGCRFLHEAETSTAVPRHSRALKRRTSISAAASQNRRAGVISFSLSHSHSLSLARSCLTEPSSKGWSSRTTPRDPSSAWHFARTTSWRRPGPLKFRVVPRKASKPDASEHTRGWVLFSPTLSLCVYIYIYIAQLLLLNGKRRVA